ncbi:MAG TPA: carboxypeptidase-like regulatory domain-containing protein [Candidatus Polarisedimenticolaceae bacterium]
MTSRSPFVAFVLVVATVAASHPAIAAAPALLEGSVVADAALTGARVELADRAGAVVATAPVTDQGTFQLESIPAGTYRLAVTTPKGAYAAGSTLTLAAGSRQNVQIAVKQGGTGGASGSGSFWSTSWGKFTGVALVAGTALGAIMLMDDDEETTPPAPASPSEPLGK